MYIHCSTFDKAQLAVAAGESSTVYTSTHHSHLLQFSTAFDPNKDTPTLSAVVFARMSLAPRSFIDRTPFPCRM